MPPFLECIIITSIKASKASTAFSTHNTKTIQSNISNQVQVHIYSAPMAPVPQSQTGKVTSDTASEFTLQDDISVFSKTGVYIFHVFPNLIISN